MASESDIRSGGAAVEVTAEFAGFAKGGADERKWLDSLSSFGDTVSRFVPESTAKINRAFERAGEEAGGGFFDRLNDSFGRGSIAGAFAKLFTGGGAIFALSKIGSEIDGVVDKAVELKDAFNDGSKSGGEVAIELAKSVPVLGEIVKAGEGINELLTGDKAALREAQNNLAQVEKSFRAVESAIEAGTKGLREMSDVLNGLHDQRTLLTAGPTEKGTIESRIDAMKALSDINKKFGDEQSAILEAVRKSLGLGEGDVNSLIVGKIKDLQQTIASLDSEISYAKNRIGQQDFEESPFSSYLNAQDIEDMSGRRSALQQQLDSLRGVQHSISAAIDPISAEHDKAIEELQRLYGETTMKAIVEGAVKPATDWVLGWAARANKANADALKNIHTQTEGDMDEAVGKFYEHLHDRAASLIEETLTPGEKFEQGAREAHGLFDNGLLNADQLDRVMQRLRDELNGPLATPKFSEAGTFNGAVAAMLGSGGTAERTAKATERTARAVEKIQKGDGGPTWQ